MTMELTFFKYQGAGNDFIMIDNRNKGLLGNESTLYAQWCHRRFGIGADGLILLQEKPGYDFEMKYYNADGSESTMCGNGGRCVVLFANHLGIINTDTTFWAIDGPHQARILPNGNISLQMGDVSAITNDGDAFVLNTGSPHYVLQVPEVNSINVFEQGKSVRNAPAYAREGINVNFLEIDDAEHLKVRTYERGVEDETYACGTGVTACAIVASCILAKPAGRHRYEIKTLVDVLAVEYEWNFPHATDIWLTGPALKVFEGTIML